MEDVGGAQGAEEEEEDGDGDLNHQRSCYLCKNWFTKLHHFYDQFCPSCAEVNWEKRHQATVSSLFPLS